MPNSITSVRLAHPHHDSNMKSIAAASSVNELVALVPTIFRTPMEPIIAQAHRTAVKAGHVRSYLSKLEKHKKEATFPAEIAGRINSPSVQSSKEFAASLAMKNFEMQVRTSRTAHLAATMALVKGVKEQELSFLSSQIEESYVDNQTRSVLHTVCAQFFESKDFDLSNASGAINVDNAPKWLKPDLQTFQMQRNEYALRAIAIAYNELSRETIKRFKSLQIKSTTDDDITMGESSATTVDALVEEKLKKLFKEQKIMMPSKSTRPDQFYLTRQTNDQLSKKSQKNPRQGKPQTPGSPSVCQTAVKAKTESDDGETGRRKRKSAWRKETAKEVGELERALGHAVASDSAAPPGVGVDPFVDTRRVRRRLNEIQLTTTASRSRLLWNTDESSLFLDRCPDLFLSVNNCAREQFVARHFPPHLFEHNHVFDQGVFCGPGVALPREFEYFLALNGKFILHKNPDPLLVHQAWPHLERSVRLRWHFRDSDRVRSKFYVPKPNWQPREDQRNYWIEEGLRHGHELLLAKAQSLQLSQLRRPNPDLAKIRKFLQLSQFLVKLTDKNLGIAVLSKNWYETECEKLLSNTAVYKQIDRNKVLTYRNRVIKRIENFISKQIVTGTTADYLSLSDNDGGIPQFHAIPKVHKTVWSLRPIIPSHSWVTKRSSQICDFVLRQCVKRSLPWVVDSSREVLRRLHYEYFGKSEQLWLVTGDVKEFYTNVPIAQTTNSISQVLGSEAIQGIVPCQIKHLLKHVMEANCFQFGEKYYRQVAGIAMGTSCAPAFANLSLGLLESKTFVGGSTSNQRDKGLLFYVRYIDDIFLIFNGLKSTCESWLNAFASTLKPYTITWEIHSCRTPTSFLDMEFFFEQGFGPVGLQSRVYRKRLNKHQYIPWSSAHPESVKRAFFKAELTRFLVISSQKHLYEERVREFREALGRRGYPSVKLHGWSSMVKYQDRLSSLFKQKEIADGLPLMLPSQYDEVWEYMDLREVFTTMKSYWEHTGSLPESLSGPLIKSLKRTDNLFDKIAVWNKAILHNNEVSS